MSNCNGNNCGGISTPGTSAVEEVSKESGNTFITPNCGEECFKEYVQVNVPVVHPGCPTHALQTIHDCCTTGFKSNYHSYCPDRHHLAPAYDTTRCGTAIVPKKGVINTIRQQDCGEVKVLKNHTLKIKNSFQMPAFNSKASVALDTESVANGTIIYNENVGWLQVVDYRSSDSTASVLNFLQDGQVLAPGEAVSPCTEFAHGVPVPPNVSGGFSSTTDVCLESDFFSMAVSSTGSNAVRVEVSSSQGMNVGSRLAIAGFEYVVKAVINATQIDIFNDGSGAPAGTKIEGGVDCNGACINRIVILGTESPCSKTAVPEADYVIVCDGGVETILELDEGEVVGKKDGKVTGVLVAVDDTPRTTFDGCVVLNPAVTEYAVIVADPTGFAEGGIVFFDCDDQERRFLIDSISGNNFILTPDFTVTAIENIADDCDNCNLVLASCCEALEKRLITEVVGTNECPTEDDPASNGGIGEDYNILNATINGNQLIINGSPAYGARTSRSESELAFDLQNPGDFVEIELEQEVINDSCRNWISEARLLAVARGTVAGSPQELTVSVEIDRDDGNGYVLPANANFLLQDAAFPQDIRINRPRNIRIPAGDTRNLKARFRITKNNAGGSFSSPNSDFVAEFYNIWILR